MARQADIYIGYRAAAAVKHLARLHDVSLQKMCRRLQINPRLLYTWGYGSAPSAYALSRLAAAGVDMNWLIKGDYTPGKVRVEKEEEETV